MNLKALVIQFEARSLRERLLIAATLFSAIWGLWAYTLDVVVVETKAEVTTNISRMATQVRATTATQQEAILGWPRRLDLTREQQAVQQELNTASKRIEHLMSGAVNPQDVARLLRTLLARYSGIEVVELTNLPVKEVFVEGQRTGLYRHPLRLTMQGKFPEVVAYVEALEELPGGLSFSRLHYEVEEYPFAMVVLEVESLSDRQAWFGV